MSIFGFYFVTNLLEQAGWPRKKGLFGGLFCDTHVVDKTIDQMLAWSASLAAGRPELSLQMIAEMCRNKDWDGPESPDIIMYIELARAKWDKHLEGGPADVVQPWRLSETRGKTISSEQFADRKLTAALEQLCLDAILWGLGNPTRVTQWYAKHRQAVQASLKDMQRAGLQVDAQPEFDDWLEQCANILAGYERDINPLPPIPRKLRQDAEKLGVSLI